MKMLPKLTSKQICERRARLPLRFFPLVYFSFAHICLLSAGTIIGVDPRGIAGFFYHPQMLAVVHLVTLGWISSSILGALYLILPMAFRAPLERRQIDRWILAAYVTGVLGMVGHFLLDEPRGMLWSAGVVLVAFCLAAIRFLPAIARSKAGTAVQLHFYFAFANILLAGLLGMTAGLSKLFPFLPGNPLTGVIAHAHLAMLGWGTLTVMAAGYRLIPMLLPAAIPGGRIVWLSAVLTEVGVLALVASLFLLPSLVPAAALTCMAGVAAFGYQLVWMRRNPRPAPVARRNPDLGIVQTLQAFFYLAIAVLLGLALAMGSPAIWKIQAAMAYGVLFLLGFLGQIVAGVSSRVVPWAAYLWAFADSGFQRTPPSPHELPHRPSQWLMLGAWSLAVAVLAVGLTFDRIGLISAGGWLLASGALAGAVSLQLVLIRSRVQASTGEST